MPPKKKSKEARIDSGSRKPRRLVTREQAKARHTLLERMMIEGWPVERIAVQMRERFNVGPKTLTKLVVKVYLSWQKGDDVHAQGGNVARAREVRQADEAIRKVLYASDGKQRVTDAKISVIVNGQSKNVPNEDRLDMGSLIRLLEHKSSISGSLEAAKAIPERPVVDVGGPELVGPEE